MSRVLVACEFSGVVRDAFAARGHEAWSCDLLPTERPGNHYQGDVRDILSEKRDLIIAHPPCTYLFYAANRVWNTPGRAELRESAMKFFMLFVSHPCGRVCVENPVGYPNTVYRKPDQIIHPYYFGEPFQKRTCLWLKNLPRLVPTKMLPKPEPLYISQGEKTRGQRVNWCDGIRGLSKEHRSIARSRTFMGIAKAMGDQWGGLL